MRLYVLSGATKLIQPEEAKHLVPLFIIREQEGEKLKQRLISDCRELNQFFYPKKFRLEHLGQVFSTLKRGCFCGKLDLKDA